MAISNPNSSVVCSGGAGDGDGDDPLVDEIVTTLTVFRSKSRWSRLRHLLIQPPEAFPAIVSAVLIRLRRNPRLALRFFSFVSPRLVPLSLPLLTASAHLAARARLRRLSLSYLRRAVSLSPCPDPGDIFRILSRSYRAFDSAPFVFDLLVLALLDSRRLDAALLIARRISPSLPTCNALLRHTALEDGANTADRLFNELFKGTASPNSSSFNTLMLAFYREGDIAKLEEIWMSMEAFNCNRNGVTYGILMAAYCEDGKLDKARELWEEMTAKAVRRDSVVYNILIGAYCEMKMMERAEEVYREMAVTGIDPTEATFERMITGYCTTGELESAMALREEMEKRGFSVTSEVVDALVQGFYRKGKTTEGLQVLREEVRRDRELCPSRKSYEVLIEGLCKEGLVDEATIAQAEMAGRGYEAGEKVYRSFLGAFGRTDSGKAAKLEEEMRALGLA